MKVVPRSDFKLEISLYETNEQNRGLMMQLLNTAVADLRGA